MEGQTAKIVAKCPFCRYNTGMERQLTDKRMRTLRFIYDYIKSNDCAPSMKEIREALGVSLGTACNRMNFLFGHGYLRRLEVAQCGRNIALTEMGILACEGDDNGGT